MELSYYTIEQAARKLNCMPDEVEHLILTEKLEAQLYSNLKKFIVLEKLEGGLIGRGIATYEGLIKIHPSYMRQIILTKTTPIKGLIAITQPQSFRHWSKTHQFKSDLFLEFVKIQEWRPCSIEDVKDQSYMMAAPLPHESLGSLHMVNKALNLFAKNQGIERTDALKQVPQPEYSYSYIQNGTYHHADIRITQEVIINYLDTQNSAKAIAAAKTSQENLPWCSSKQKPSRIDPVIERLFLSDKPASAKTLWTKLERDADLDDPLYDKEHIIQAIDGLVLDWENQSKRISELRFKTFSNKVSEIRKYYSSNN